MKNKKIYIGCFVKENKSIYQHIIKNNGLALSENAEEAHAIITDYIGTGLDCLDCDKPTIILSAHHHESNEELRKRLTRQNFKTKKIVIEVPVNPQRVLTEIKILLESD
ncbi:MAG: hypothetical protein ACOYMB_02270 [Patescibacteria group bacterium]